MKGPPLGPGGEDITWPDQVAPQGPKGVSYPQNQTSHLKPFCQVVPCKKTDDGEGVLKLIKHHWIGFYGPPVRIHSDKDIRYKGDYGWYRNVFAAMGVEVSFSQRYRPQSNR